MLGPQASAWLAHPWWRVEHNHRWDKNRSFAPGIDRPELLGHEVVHEESHALDQTQQHPPNHS